MTDVHFWGSRAPMPDSSPDEAQAVALAMLQAGSGTIIPAQALREARVFIAAAEALLRCRLAQQGPKGREDLQCRGR